MVIQEFCIVAYWAVGFLLYIALSIVAGDVMRALLLLRARPPCLSLYLWWKVALPSQGARATPAAVKPSCAIGRARPVQTANAMPAPIWHCSRTVPTVRSQSFQNLEGEAQVVFMCSLVREAQVVRFLTVTLSTGLRLHAAHVSHMSANCLLS